jgi:hypothetical protein
VLQPKFLKDFPNARFTFKHGPGAQRGTFKGVWLNKEHTEWALEKEQQQRSVSNVGAPSAPSAPAVSTCPCNRASALTAHNVVGLTGTDVRRARVHHMCSL